MRRRFECTVTALAVTLLLPLAQRVAAQGIVPHKGNVNIAVANAKIRHVPLFLYVPESRDDEEEKDNVKRAIMRAFADKRVETFANVRFETVKLHRNNTNAPIREKFGVHSMQGVICTPDGEQLAKLSQADLCRPEKILEHMTKASREYRRRIYERDIRPVLSNREEKPDRLCEALAIVRDREMLLADKDVAAMAGTKLDKRVRSAVIETLRELSTPDSVAALLQLARSDTLARRELEKCRRGALATLAGSMNSLFDDVHIIAYEACCKMLKTPMKPREFWKWKIDKPKVVERDRVGALARKAALEWDEHRGRYR